MAKRSAPLAAVIALAMSAIGFTPVWRGLEERAQGLLVSIRGPRPWNPAVVVLEVDASTTRELGSIGRDTYAQVVNGLMVSGAKVAAFDLFFVAPSIDPNDDLLLSGIAQAWGKVVLPVECLPNSVSGDLLPPPLPLAGSTPARQCPSLSLPARALRDAAGLAHVSLASSPSGYFRGVHAWLEAGRRRAPTLAVAALARAEGIKDLKQEPRSLTVGQRSFRVDSSGVLIPSHRGFPDSARVSFRWVVAELEGAPPDLVPASLVERFKDKYVIVGPTASPEDHGQLLSGQTFPLAVMHASLLSDLLEGSTMRELAPWGTAVLVALAVLLFMAIALRFRPAIATVLAVGALGGFLAAGVWLVGQGWLIPPAAPGLAGGFAFVAAIALRGRERHALRTALVGSLDPSMLDCVLGDPDRYLALGGAKKTVSVLFTDIRGFTELPAEQVMPVLREYLEAIASVAKKREGRIERILGGGVLAVFGDPMPNDDHALRAVTAGMEMLEEVARLQHVWTSQGKKGIAIRIGVATGEVVVGNVGTATVEYAVLGPTVDLASRLEAKAPAGAMAVSEETYQACKQRYAFHAIGGLALKGFTDSYKAWLFVGTGLQDDPERHAPRLPTQAPATVRLGAQTVQGIVENVSAGGLYVIAEGAVAAGDLVELEFAPSSHLVAAVTVRAQVRHVERREDGQQGFGVRIERADATHGEDLRHFVALYLGPQPDGGKVDSGGDTFRMELGEAYGRLIKEKPT